MPYTGPSDSAIPDHVKTLPLAARRRWVAVWNAEYQKALDDKETDAVAEEAAFKAASKAMQFWQNKEAHDDPSTFDGMTAFLKALRAQLKDTVPPAVLEAAVKKARASSGGQGRAAKLRAGSDVECPTHSVTACEECYAPVSTYEPPKLEKADERVSYRDAEELGVTCGDCRFYQYGKCGMVEGDIDRVSTCDLFVPRAAYTYSDDSGRQYARQLYVEAPQAFAEAPDWMPLMPKPGQYKHAKWGTITISKERNKRFVDNFNNAVYNQQLPIDAEHQNKLSGAVGYIKELRENSDGSVDAKPEWTDRGAALIAAGGYKYVSPEWFDEWEQPESAKTYKDVVIGAAITTRPFFKEAALRPLVASETGIYIAGNSDDAYTQEGSHMPPEDGTKPAAVDPQQFAELTTKLDAERAAREASEVSAKAMAEEIAALKAENMRKQFTDEVLGRSDANGQRWFGETDKHVATLTALASAYGPESEQVQTYITTQRAAAEAMKSSAAFTEQGTTKEGGAGGAWGIIQARATAMVGEGKAKTFSEAVDAVTSSDAALAAQYAKER